MAEMIRPFDTSFTPLETRAVPIHRIVDILHVTHAPDRIDEYRRAMLSGNRFPPISVIRMGRSFVITDGHKRFAACRAIGITTLDVELWTAGKLVADQIAQARRYSRLWWRTLSGLHRGRRARRQAWALVKSTLFHWWRVAVSLWGVVVNPRHPASGGIRGKG